jgi:hypothetical protein
MAISNIPSWSYRGGPGMPPHSQPSGGRAAEIIGSVGHLNALRGLFGRNDLLAAHSNSSPQFPASPAPRRAIVLVCLATLI